VAGTDFREPLRRGVLTRRREPKQLHTARAAPDELEELAHAYIKRTGAVVGLFTIAILAWLAPS
jgi:hypothetical protein